MKLSATHTFNCIVLMEKFGRTSCEDIPLALSMLVGYDHALSTGHKAPKFMQITACSSTSSIESKQELHCLLVVPYHTTVISLKS